MVLRARLISLLLIPCLLADPALGRTSDPSAFQGQALAERALSSAEKTGLRRGALSFWKLLKGTEYVPPQEEGPLTLGLDFNIGRAWLTAWPYIRSFSITLWTFFHRWENPRRLGPLYGKQAAAAGFPNPVRIQDLYNLTRLYLAHTPLLEAEGLSADLSERLSRHVDVLVKYEPDQETGAYKPRGVLADVVAHALEILRRGESLKDYVWVTESTGNHGGALAWAVSLLPTILDDMGIPHDLQRGNVEIYVPGEPAIPLAKRNALLSFQDKINIHVIDGVYEAGVLVKHFEDYEEAREAVLRRRGNPGVIHVEHDSENVMAGHGGLLLELMEDLDHRDLLDRNGKLKVPVTIIAPAGSFGMIAGVALAARHFLGENIRVVAAQSTNIRGGTLSLIFGFIIKNTPLRRLVIEDGTAVDKIGERAFRLFRRLGDAGVIVRDIPHGVRELFRAIRAETNDRPFEGSAGNAAQALYEYPHVIDSPDGTHKTQVVILILSGGNTDEQMWAKAGWDKGGKSRIKPAELKPPLRRSFLRAA